MQINSFLKKGLPVGIVLLLVGLPVVPHNSGGGPLSTEIICITYAGVVTNPGTLSGYVTDAMMHPIEGAQVQVFFHNESREDYSASGGYYHVTDIPICNCTKNATCTKPGYNPVWIYLTIGQNTTHDFMLTPNGNPIISGPGVGRIGVSYNFTIFITDPDGDDLFYLWEWGDGDSSGWLGPYASGQPVVASHAWSKEGTYTILVRAKDPYGVEIVSNPFVIQIVKLKVSLAFGSFNNQTETEDLIIIHTNVLFIIPSHPILSLGRTIVISKQYHGFFNPFLFGGVFQVALLPKHL
jgi:hypothetical protein